MPQLNELSPRSKTGGNYSKNVRKNGSTVNTQARRFRKKERKRKTKVAKILACKMQF
jgi:hypothetical protein